MGRVKKQTVTQTIMQDVRDKLSHIVHDHTRKQYTNHAKAYVRYCRTTHGVKAFEACVEYLQDYSAYLCQQGYSASTIHTYLAAVCAVWGVKLDTIQKPVRHTAEYTRGRTTNVKGVNSDLNDPKWRYLVEFQRVVGIRRNELRKLKGCDFAYDESGQPCVVVRRGKGGKLQYQRIDPKKEEFIGKYFAAVGKDERIFAAQLFDNDLNLHSLRAECAKEYYFNTLEKINVDPQYAAQLEREIRARWKLYCTDKDGRVKRLRSSEICGWYTLRGKNRALAISKGLPLRYHKLALLATSIFKLSHWRNDVTVVSYLLA
jgi:hypothetical protein